MQSRPQAPPRVDDIERYWSEPPPALSPRVGSLGYYSKAQYLGVYLYEYLEVISPRLCELEHLEYPVRYWMRNKEQTNP